MPIKDSVLIQGKDLNEAVADYNRKSPSLTAPGDKLTGSGFYSGAPKEITRNLRPRATTTPTSDLSVIPFFFPARITGNTQGGGNQWVYTFERVNAETMGINGPNSGFITSVENLGEVHGWNADDPYGRAELSGTCYNRCEVPNSPAGIQGNGLNQDNFGYTDTEFPHFHMQPITAGVIVLLYNFGQPNDPLYWFSQVNAIDGSCEAPA